MIDPGSASSMLGSLTGGGAGAMSGGAGAGSVGAAAGGEGLAALLKNGGLAMRILQMLGGGGEGAGQFTPMRGAYDMLPRPPAPPASPDFDALVRRLYGGA